MLTTNQANIGNAKKTVIHIPNLRASQYLFLFDIRYYSKFSLNLMNVSRINYSSPMHNTVTNEFKQFPQFFSLGPQIALKRKWHYFLS